MSVVFLAGERQVWAALTREARAARRSDVAVAYVGQGAVRRLPLGEGSRLVVDASEPTVRAGGTCPAELLKLVRRGVEIFSRPGLHAKVFVFGRAALIGSANVSSASAERLVEAMIRTTDTDAVRAARRFVTEIASGVPLGPDALERLQAMYRPPRRHPSPGHVGRTRGPKVWFEWFEEGDPPEGSEVFIADVLSEAKAKRRQKRGFDLIETWRPGPPSYAPNDIIIMTGGDGRREMVSPPARVVHVKTWANGRSRTTFSVLELPERRRVAKHRLAKGLGRGWATTLSRYGKLNRRNAAALLAWWNERI